MRTEFFYDESWPADIYSSPFPKSAVLIQIQNMCILILWALNLNLYLLKYPEKFRIF